MALSPSSARCDWTLRHEAARIIGTPQLPVRAEAARDGTEGDLSLVGTRVFVVEDEALALLSLLDMLDGLGCNVAASAQRMDDAMRKAADLSFDIALLDVSIAGKRVDPVADLLARRNIPFAFTSGYEQEALPERFRDRPLLAKPYVAAQLHATLAAGLARVNSDRPHAA